jgi:hypothetical protein
MKRLSCLVWAAATFAVVGCGDPSQADQPLTLADAAPAMRQTVASAVVAALEGSASATSASRTSVWRSAPISLDAANVQTFLANCPTGGRVRIENVITAGTQFTLSNASATFTSCGFYRSRPAAVMNGALILNGVWCPGQSSCKGFTVTQPDMPVRMTGSLDVSDLGSVAFLGTVGLDAYALDVGGIGVSQGKPDTPPSPNPNSCPATLSPSSISAPQGGGTFSVTVTVDSVCSWTAASNSGFITVTSGASGRGNGTVTLSVAANADVARTGSLSIAGQNVSASQAGTAVANQFDGQYTGTYTVTSGGTGSGGVAYTVANGAITVTAPQAGSGQVNSSGSITFGATAGGCTFAGTAVKTGNAVSATGTWQCPAPAVGLSASSGPWSASRQ